MEDSCTTQPRGSCQGTRASRAEPAREKRSRNVWFRDPFAECEVLDRYALEAGTTVEGPAVIEERESTCGRRVALAVDGPDPIGAPAAIDHFLTFTPSHRATRRLR